ncbi:hypothetical protein F5972_07470 [Microbispora cellulosiformans]|uniref:Uncharacterized protein n=1 Tax=Microbispora cellulosiformans TaxID=2614688 RepID=A0A5J5K8V7_9ACTN|nr:hypothetical protein [Microbispora cellulosiformans]KAA9380916.1 hypothetical protein F5972_07470 [Microbispora cellulosiformans]
MKVHAARDALIRVARCRCASLVVAVAAVLGAALAIGFLPGLTSAAYAVPTRGGGDGGGGVVASDRNGNGSRITVGNGGVYGNYMVIGSLKNANGLQQATIGVNGNGNSQGNVCRRRGGPCWFNQNAWVRTGRW